jgi:phosphatidylserine decarboxylase
MSLAAWAAVVGASSRAQLPGPMRRLAYGLFARTTGARLEEAELEIAEYRSLGDLFARRLRRGARVVDADALALIAPCDGVVAAHGTVDDGQLVQAKGHSYALADLVVDDERAARLAGGSYATIYLSPRDYHRVHAPVDARLVGYDYVPGAQWPVNPRVAARRARLLVRNERVVIWLEAPGLGLVAVVMVGAGGVGNIRLQHAPETRMWRGAGELRHVELDEPVAKGDELGAFMLGSTVVLVFERGAIDGPLCGAEGQVVRFGERIAQLRSRRG